MPSLRDTKPAAGQLFVLLLVTVAGMTDATLYQHSKELLAVYITGDSSKLGQFLQQGEMAKALPLLGIIGAFFISTTVTAWLGDRLASRRAPVLMTLIALLFFIAWPASAPEYPVMVVIIIALAMGALNQVDPDEPGVTFMTGTLVRLGRNLAKGAFASAAPLALRWLVWLLSAFAGAALNARFPAFTLLFIAVWSLVLAGFSLALGVGRGYATQDA
jgi:uncharacterized membrane protein YoaK (UPF0700 family)